MSCIARNIKYYTAVSHQFFNSGIQFELVSLNFSAHPTPASERQAGWGHTPRPNCHHLPKFFGAAWQLCGAKPQDQQTVACPELGLVASSSGPGANPLTWIWPPCQLCMQPGSHPELLRRSHHQPWWLVRSPFSPARLHDPIEVQTPRLKNTGFIAQLLSA